MNNDNNNDDNNNDNNNDLPIIIIKLIKESRYEV